MQTTADHATKPSDSKERSARILAKTIYRELRASGIDEKEVLAIASELLGLVAQEVRGS